MAASSALAPFRHKAFRTLWAATLVSNFGGLVQAVGAAWMMTQLTHSATLIALVQASNTLPIMLFALLLAAQTASGQVLVSELGEIDAAQETLESLVARSAARPVAGVDAELGQ